MNFIRKLVLVFTYGDEIEKVLKKQREIKLMAERDAKKDNLDLCFRHQQRSIGTHHSEHNCAYCKLEARLRVAQTSNEQLEARLRVVNVKGPIA